MMKFSQKIGKTPIRESLQLEDLDEKLENRLWNVILDKFIYKLSHDTDYSHDTVREQVCCIIWEEFFGERIDETPSSGMERGHINGVIEYLKEWFFSTIWYEQYDLLEFISSLDIKANLGVDFESNCNRALKREMSGYRLLKGSIVQITKEEEINEIEEAVANSSKWDPVSKHLHSAIKIFSNRSSPDYKNVIKEAISAVESLCVIIAEDDKATLGQALNAIESKIQLHGALKKAFSSLYGYSSGSGGIRHGMLSDDIEVTFEDAKFMLISCSAFINYLVAKEEKI